jgi:hypothetical protein
MHRNLLDGTLGEVPLTCLQYCGPHGTHCLDMVTQPTSAIYNDDERKSEIFNENLPNKGINKNYKSKDHVSDWEGETRECKKKQKRGEFNAVMPVTTMMMIISELGNCIQS